MTKGGGLDPAVRPAPGYDLGPADDGSVGGRRSSVVGHQSSVVSGRWWVIRRGRRWGGAGDREECADDRGGRMRWCMIGARGKGRGEERRARGRRRCPRLSPSPPLLFLALALLLLSRDLDVPRVMGVTVNLFLASALLWLSRKEAAASFRPPGGDQASPRPVSTRRGTIRPSATRPAPAAPPRAPDRRRRPSHRQSG